MERALKAVFQEDYTFEQSLDEFLQGMDPAPDRAQRSILAKKLKGDYEKDRAVLIETLKLPEDADLDAELIRAFLPEEGIDSTMDGIRKCILVDSKTAVTLDYDEEDIG